MTLDEAIQHIEDMLSNGNDFGCDKCKEEHIQLLGWLKELRDRRNTKVDVEKSISQMYELFDKAYSVNNNGEGTDITRMVTWYIPNVIQDMQAMRDMINKEDYYEKSMV